MTTVAALCAGYGGLELGLTHAGIDHTLAWYAEIDPHASTVMAHHHPAAPNLGDLRDITNPPPVDIVTAGFPCQPVSTAGARLGVDDGRWLIRDVVTVWRSSGARWLVLENVWGLLTANDGRAFGEVLDSLATVGATARWACVRASDIGAPHRRHRWFCIAATPDAHGPGLERRGPLPQRPTERTPREDRVDPRWGCYAPAITRWEQIVGRPTPEPTIGDGRLNPAFTEWLMGLPAGWVTQLDMSYEHQLRILGNGVVPQQAAHALTSLEAAA